MIVVDASALTNALVYADERGRRTRSVLRQDPEWAAPEHWKAEVFSAVRGLVLGRVITTGRAARAIGRLPRLGIERVSLDELLPDMWRLRSSISGYDAAYVALAASRGLTLVTGDRRLAKASTPHCRVHLVE